MRKRGILSSVKQLCAEWNPHLPPCFLSESCLSTHTWIYKLSVIIHSTLGRNTARKPSFNNSDLTMLAVFETDMETHDEVHYTQLGQTALCRRHHSVPIFFHEVRNVCKQIGDQNGKWSIFQCVQRQYAKTSLSFQLRSLSYQW